MIKRVLFGEIGLAGEVRGSTHVGLRVREAAQLGFTRCILPEGNVGPGVDVTGCELHGVGTVEAALEGLFT